MFEELDSSEYLSDRISNSLDTITNNRDNDSLSSSYWLFQSFNCWSIRVV